MGITFNIYRRYALTRLLIEGKETLQELFESPPLLQNVVIKKGKYGYYNTPPFKDNRGNTVRILFHPIFKDSYELDFMVNGSSFHSTDIEYTVRDYASLLNTVALIVDKFLVEIKPFALVLDGVDSPRLISKRYQKKGQKNRIYDYFIGKLKSNDCYKMDRTPGGGFNLVNSCRKI